MESTRVRESEWKKKRNGGVEGWCEEDTARVRVKCWEKGGVEKNKLGCFGGEHGGRIKVGQKGKVEEVMGGN